MKDYRFFLSYSRRDAKEAGQAENSWFVRFRKDLIRDVAKESALPAAHPDDEVGFYDRDGIELGDPWRASLLDALQHSRVLVCLYSQNYFASEYCGKEFQVFLQRLEENKGAHNIIIPVLWDAPTKFPEPLPAVVAESQFKHGSLGSTYAEKGLLYLLRMGLEPEYQGFLQAISERIAKAGATPVPAAQDIGLLDTVTSAFHNGSTMVAAGATTPAIQGVNAAWLVYVAGAESDYTAVRTNRAGYGSADYEWQPYYPHAQMVGVIATNVVSSNGLFPDVLHVSKQLTDNLEIAEKKNTMVLIIVDPWTVRINTFRQVFDAVDRLRLSNCGVIIPWNRIDPELGEVDSTQNTTKGKALSSELARLLSRIWDSKDVVFIKGVLSEDDFRAAINRAIKDIRARISDRGRLLRGEASEDDFPILPPGAASTHRPAA